MLRPGAQVRVEAGRDAVEAPAVRGVDPRAGVPLAGGERDLAREQQLTAAEHRRPGGQPLGVGHVVAAPGDVHRPHLAVAEAEARGACGEDQRGVRSGAAAPVLPRVHPDDERRALRGPLPAPAPGQVEQLGGHRWHREREGEAVDDERPRCRYLRHHHRGPLAQQARGQQLDVEPDLESRLVVAPDRPNPPTTVRSALGVEGDEGEERRPGAPGAVPREPRPAEPPARLLGQDADARPRVEIARHGAGDRGGGDRRQVGGVQLTEVGPPVQHRGQAPVRGEDDAHPRRPQVDGPGRVRGHGGSARRRDVAADMFYDRS
jgi:hypothetical protein